MHPPVLCATDLWPPCYWLPGLTNLGVWIWRRARGLPSACTTTPPPVYVANGGSCMGFTRAAFNFLSGTGLFAACNCKLWPSFIDRCCLVDDGYGVRRRDGGIPWCCQAAGCTCMLWALARATCIFGGSGHKPSLAQPPVLMIAGHSNYWHGASTSRRTATRALVVVRFRRTTCSSVLEVQE